MNIKNLRCFQQVYTERSINKAAKKLYITSQGLGKTIQNLENELHTILFKRTPHGVEPTESAALLYKKSEALIELFEEIENEIHQLEQQKQVLRIGCACGIFHLLPLKLISQFMEENKNLQVEWCEYVNEEVKDLLESSKIEYGFLVGGWDKENVVQRKLLSCGISLLVYEGHSLYEKKSVRIRDLQGEDVLTMNDHFHMYADVTKICRVNGIELNIVAKTADVSFLHKLCTQKTGVAIIPDFCVEQFKMLHLRAIPFEEKLSWDVYGAYIKNHDGYDVIQKFAAYLKKYFG